MDSQLDNAEKAGHVNKIAEKLQLQRMGLENEKLASEIRLINQPGSPPAVPGGTQPVIPGQGDSRRAVLDPDLGPMTLRVPTQTDDGRGTYDFQTSGTSNSQTVADQYGDAAQEIYGMYRLYNDIFANVAPRLRRAWANAPGDARRYGLYLARQQRRGSGW